MSLQKMATIKSRFSFWEGNTRASSSINSLALPLSILLLVSGFLGAPLRPLAMAHTRAGHKSIALLRRRFVGAAGYVALKKPAQQVRIKCSESAPR